MKRIPQLDGIRGIAILMVLLCHYIQNQLHTVTGMLPKYVSKSLSLTWSGVDLFFVLSGFLICGILVDNHGSPTFFRTFYARRALRIFPLYYLILGLFILLSGRIAAPLLFDTPMPSWSYATFTQNFAMVPYPDGTAQWMGMTWSLAVEEQFYLLLPLIVYILPRRTLLPVFAFGIVVAVALRLCFPGTKAFLLMPWRADSLLSGAALALLFRSKSFMLWISQNRRLLIAAFYVLLAGAAAMTAKPWSRWSHNHLWLAALYTVFLLIALTNSIPALTRLVSSAALCWLGGVSYAVYMIHGAVNGLLHWLISGKTAQIQTFGDIGITILALATTFGLAELSFRYFESPFLKWGQSFKYAAARAIPDSNERVGIEPART
jgi:peptidoglycan/LPS O-acetylase OafA/YrhL